MISYYRTHDAWRDGKTGPLAIGEIDEALLACAEEMSADAPEASDLAPKAAGFREACINDNTISDLVEALGFTEADAADCETWGITASGWRRAIRSALAAKCNHVREYAI